MVWIKPLGGSFQLPAPPVFAVSDDKLHYTVTLITPGAPTDGSWRQPYRSLFGLPGKVVSACVGKPAMIGGWDSRTVEPLALRPHLPVGSTWFIEASASDEQQILEMHGKHIGEKPAWGYGQILIGTWRDP